ncbi:MAG: hypothetical protein NTX61_15595 [Bacteroidetes bacterium]|nr:hypothetical protein [Bacteroidota bacterium]
MKSFFEKYLYLIILSLCFLFLVIMSLLSEGYYGGADNINHYFIARFAFHYPHLFMNSWGRPLYTILSSPFACLGFAWMKLFNVLLGVLTAFFSYQIAKKLDIRPAWLTIILVIFTPLYCVMLPTGLTEILFGFVLILSIYLFFDEKYIFSAIVISFIPFARTEGIVIIPILFFAYLARKKFIAIPFLLTGFVVFSIIGSFFYKDLLWIINNPAYPIHHPIYKQGGPLLHFVRNSTFIFGSPVKILFILGTFSLIYRFFRTGKTGKIRILFETWLIFVPFLVYFTAHSYLYWKTLGGSIGLVRVMAGVLPLAAILASRGVQLIDEGILRINRLKSVFHMVLIPIVLYAGFQLYTLPVKLGPEESVVKNTTKWVKDQGLTKKPVFFTDLNVPFFLDMDVYNTAKCDQIWFAKDIKTIPDSCIFIWDAHFGPNESQTPLDSLMLNPHLRLIGLFEPESEIITFGGYNYEVYVFRNFSGIQIQDNRMIRDSLLMMKDESFSNEKSLVNCDFEMGCPGMDAGKILSDTAHSGNHSYRMAFNDEFGGTVTTKYREISARNDAFRVRATFFIYPLVPFSINKTDVVISLEDKKSAYSYHGFPLEKMDLKVNQWNAVSLRVNLPEVHSADDVVKFYFWHQGKKEFLIDDLRVEVLLKK